MFSEIYIYNAVYDEVVINGKGEAGSEETAFAVRDGWMLKKAVEDELACSALMTVLGRGEAEVTIVCRELKLDCALIDERIAIVMAEILNVNTMGVLGIIDLAAQLGFAINKKEAIDRLKDMGFRISEKLYKKMFPE